MSTDISEHSDLRTDDRLADAWERMEDGARRASTPPRAGPPAHVRVRSTADPEHRRVGTAVAGLVGILVVIVLAGVAAHALHGSPASTAGSGPPAHPTSSAPGPSQVAALADGTNDIVSATTATQAGFAAMKGLPTPATVAVITNPYVDSLQLYAALLAESTVPPAARAADRQVSAQVRSDVDFLESINGLPPVELGTFLHSFYTHAAVLQAQLGALERDLGIHTG
jgi:hypothetical protein